MTGLDASCDSILQIACLITDHELNVLDPDGWGAIIQHSSSQLDRMNDWCIKTHASTGLTDAALSSSTTAEQAAAQLLQYIKRQVPMPRTALLAGNSVHVDKAFLSQGPFAEVVDHLHYRILDVSSIKEAARRWAPLDALRHAPIKDAVHEARRDILESIEEARFFKRIFFEKAIDRQLGLVT